MFFGRIRTGVGLVLSEIATFLCPCVTIANLRRTQAGHYGEETAKVSMFLRAV